MVNLKIDYCDIKAAKYACNHWHYSHSVPTPPQVFLGVWEDDIFVGCVIFSRGSNNNLGKPFGLKQIEICELTRVALSRRHTTKESRILSICLKLIKRKEPLLRLIISFADANQSHSGVIYQASNWIYLGQAKGTKKHITKSGVVLHDRQVSKTGFKRQYGQVRKVPTLNEVTTLDQLPKYRYAYPLDDAMRQQIEPLKQPYPKRASEVNGVTGSDQLQEGGSSPTQTLNLVELDS